MFFPQRANPIPLLEISESKSPRIWPKGCSSKGDLGNLHDGRFFSSNPLVIYCINISTVAQGKP